MWRRGELTRKERRQFDDLVRIFLEVDAFEPHRSNDTEQPGGRADDQGSPPRRQPDS